jgi:hypothetical protein
MRILLLPAYFHPETVASGYLTESRDEAFTSAGFDLVTRLSPLIIEVIHRKLV